MPEILLWQHLRQRPEGLKFRRQHPVGPYVVDFGCMSERSVIEVDGYVHDTCDRPARDTIRTRFLEDNGYKVLRVPGRQVLADAIGTAQAIAAGGGMPLHHPAGGPPSHAEED